MIKKIKYQKITLAISAFLALTSVQQTATGADAIVKLEGTITGPTCVLIGDTGNGSAPANGQTLNLGSDTLANATPSSGSIGSSLGTSWSEKTITFKLTDGGGSTSCSSFSGLATGWDVALAPLNASDIFTDGDASNGSGTTYLKSSKSIMDGGTDAIVALTGGIGSEGRTKLSLKSSGTYVSGLDGSLGFKAQAASSITLGAQLVNGKTAGKPTAGTFATSIALSVNYK